MRIALADVFVHAIVCDEPPSSAAGPVRLGIYEPGVVVHGRQQGGAGLNGLLSCYSVFGDRRMKLWLVGFGAGERILQRQRYGCAGAGTSYLICTLRKHARA